MKITFLKKSFFTYLKLVLLNLSLVFILGNGSCNRPNEYCAIYSQFAQKVIEKKGTTLSTITLDYAKKDEDSCTSYCAESFAKDFKKDQNIDDVNYLQACYSAQRRVLLEPLLKREVHLNVCEREYSDPVFKNICLKAVNTEFSRTANYRRDLGIGAERERETGH